MRLRLIVSVIGEFCGLANGTYSLTMTLSAFLVVIVISTGRAVSEFAITVMPATYIDLTSH